MMKRHTCKHTKKMRKRQEELKAPCLGLLILQSSSEGTCINISPFARLHAKRFFVPKTLHPSFKRVLMS